MESRELSQLENQCGRKEHVPCSSWSLTSNKSERALVGNVQAPEAYFARSSVAAFGFFPLTFSLLSYVVARSNPPIIYCTTTVVSPAALVAV